MTIRIISNQTDEQYVTEEKDVLMIEFENQEHLNNGMWLHLIRKDRTKDISIEFDPKTDWFDIF